MEGDGNLPITKLARIEDADAHALTFLHNPKYTTRLYQSDCAAVLVAEDFQPTAPFEATLIRVAHPYEAFVKLLHLIEQQQERPTGHETPHVVHPTAQLGQDTYLGAFSHIGAGCVIGNRVRIHPHVTIGPNTVIGDDTELFPHVTVYADTVMGQRCIIHAGAVIGSDGFGYLQDGDGVSHRIPQVGNVVLEDEVEIGANTCIDRATVGSTIIRQGAKLDNLIHIAHNVEIGARSVMAAQVGISGSCRIGQGCFFGGQAGLTGHIDIADGTQLGAKTGVTKSVQTAGQVLRGGPAQPLSQQLRMEALQRKLPELFERLAALEQEVQQRNPSQQ